MTGSSKERLAAVSALPPRLRRELATVSAMIAMYCRSHHDSGSTLCEQCRELETYATRRLSHCPFAEQKPTCAKCPVHCYSPARRSGIIEVMRFSGPRMVFFHPYLALHHLLDGRRVVKKLSRQDNHRSPDQGESL